MAGRSYTSLRAKAARSTGLARRSITLSLPALALVADSVRINDPVVASTISEMQRDARGQAARTFYEYWSTGDEAY